MGVQGLQKPMGRLEGQVQKQRALRVERGQESGDLLLDPEWPQLHDHPSLHSADSRQQFLTCLSLASSH